MHNSILGHNILSKHLEEEDKILYIAHKHPLLILRSMFLFIVIGVLIPYALWFSNPDLVFVAILMLGSSILRFAYMYSLYFYDCWVITNNGIIDIEWISFFNRKVIRIEFDHFEGISTNIRGFLDLIFRKGDVTLVRIIDDAHTVSIKSAYKPNRIESEVLHAKDSYHKGHSEKSDKMVEILSDMIHDHARRKGIKL